MSILQSPPPPEKISRWFLLGLFLATGAWAQPGSSQGPMQYPVEIRGTARNSEQSATTLVLVVRDQPVHTQDEEAYTPAVLAVSGAPLYASWQSPLEIQWDFGDGSGVVVLKDQVSVTHVYEDEGNYVVTATARDNHGVFATATHEVEVVNRDPFNIRMGAVEVEPEQYIVELTASAQDAAGDSELTYEWDFGDGGTASGADLWWSRHQYAAPGVYEVKLTVTDDDYPSSFGGHERNDGKKEDTLKVVVGRGTGPPMDFTEAEVQTDGVATNRLTGTSSGAINAAFNAEIRHFRGLYLSQIDPGVCRFVYTAWDNANLAYMMGIADLRGVRPEGSGFRVSNPKFSIEFLPDANAYNLTKTSWIGRTGEAGLGGFAALNLEKELAKRGVELDEEQQQVFKEKLGESGLEARAREPGETSAVPDVSPYGIEESVSFTTQTGKLELNFVPGDRADGTYHLVMKAGYGPYKDQTFDFSGQFDLDLVAARRDGIVNYTGCEPPPFEVRRVWPESGTRHFYPDRPPVSVKFTEDLDPASLNDGTFQITYVNTADDAVPISARILRDHDTAYLVPEEPLLPGVEYTARIKAGEGGVHSRAGQPLEANSEDDWYSWKFTTRIDVVSEPAVSLAGSHRYFACHMFR